PTPTSPLFPYTTLFRSVRPLVVGIPEIAPHRSRSHHRATRRQIAHQLAHQRRVVLHVLDDFLTIDAVELAGARRHGGEDRPGRRDRKSTRLNSSHLGNS